jgi:predicted component of type VI protein secretion system
MATAKRVRFRQIEPEPRELGEFTAERILVGKSPECQVRFSGVHGISGIHAIIEWRSDRLWVTDPGARNPVELDGAVIPYKTPLPVTSGNKLKLGHIVIEVSFAKGNLR